MSRDGNGGGGGVTDECCSSGNGLLFLLTITAAGVVAWMVGAEKRIGELESHHIMEKKTVRQKLEIDKKVGVAKEKVKDAIKKNTKQPAVKKA